MSKHTAVEGMMLPASYFKVGIVFSDLQASTSVSYISVDVRISILSLWIMTLS